MRIIAGKYKGRKFDLPKDSLSRPTLDRIKENIFNIINFNIPNSVCLDLFAGSGALGLESLSRNAKEVYFIDEKNDNIKNIKSFLNNVNDSNGKCFCLDYEDALKKFSNEKRKFDIVFLDPPFKLKVIDELIEYIIDNDLLADDGYIVCEYPKEDVVRKDYDGFNVKLCRRYSSSEVLILEKE